MQSVQLRWELREPPLAVAGVVARSAAALRLANVLCEPGRVGAEGLRAAADTGWLLLLGSDRALPWADGATYLGWDHGLLTPTTLRPLPEAFLLRRAIDRQGDADPGGVTVVLPGVILTTAPLRRTVDVARLIERVGIA